jgi:hypothetical protein
MQDRTKEVAVRKEVVSEFESLDPVMDDPSRESPFRGEEQEIMKFAELALPTLSCWAERPTRASRLPGSS